MENSWRSDSACRNQDPDLFFPLGTTGRAATQIREAKDICVVCPVQLDCLNWALLTNQDTGIWGGTTEHERVLLRRHRASI